MVLFIQNAPFNLISQNTSPTEKGLDLLLKDSRGLWQFVIKVGRVAGKFSRPWLRLRK